jgi:hypothetical protein
MTEVLGSSSIKIIICSLRAILGIHESVSEALEYFNLDKSIDGEDFKSIRKIVNKMIVDLSFDPFPD